MRSTFSKAPTGMEHGNFEKTPLLAMILGCAMGLLAADAFAEGLAGTGLEGTGHDFSSHAWSQGKTCTVCHNTTSEWGHEPSSQVYTLSNSPTLDALDHGQPSGVSANCLSCHDGTVALDSFRGQTGSTFISPAVRLGPDLSTHHPVSFTFDPILAAIDSGLRDPSTAPSGLGGTIAEDLLECDGKMECNTCHSMHWDAGNEDILIKPVASLCLTCHDHGATSGSHFPGGENPWGSCSLCHGEDLRGGVAKSCMDCHGDFVYPNPPQLGHHYPGRDAPYANGCTDCHNTDLQGGIGPSCFTCHEKNWVGDPSDALPPSNHTEVKLNFAKHKPGFGTPTDSGCTLCHGTNLDDGFAPSCMQCHEPIWQGSGPPSDHTEVRNDFADHKPGMGDPIPNGCTQCHGPNLTDGFAFSCTACHEPLWKGAGPPADHTDVKRGFADHKPGAGDPIANGCTQCHGPNLTDGFAFSCTACHEPLWKGAGPPSSHDVLIRDFADHMPGLYAPIENGCTQCHGPNLNDGFAFSCFACHGELWGEGNRPPDVDTGGPYSAAIGATVTFVGSAIDPDSDALTYEWDFGDGSPTFSGPTATHAYATAGTYTAELSVSDSVNAPVLVNVVVEISDDPTIPSEGTWAVSLPLLFTELTVEFEDFGDFLLVRTTRADGQISFGIGMELDKVIFWIDMTNELFFGNLDQDAGTGQGVVFDLQGGSNSIWSAERLNVAYSIP